MSRRGIIVSLVLVTLVGAGLRLWRIGSLPALNADEAAIGYNAYSLLLTGKDEFGNPWPVHFVSFGDYKPGGYFYMVLPFVAILGLSEVAVRLPAVVMGILTIPLMYLLMMGVFCKKGKEWGVVAALLLAVSPWHILFSRGGWEVNVATFWIVLGVWALVRAARRATLASYLLFAVSWVVALYTYHAARVVVPLLGVGMMVIYREQFLLGGKRGLRLSFVAMGVAIVLLVPLFRDVFSGRMVGARASGVGILSDSGPFWRANDLRAQHGGQVPAVVVRGLHNRVVTYGLEFIANWAGHFDGHFLFIDGDKIQRNKVPETGQLHVMDLLLWAVGIVVLMGLVAKGEKGGYLVGWWLVVGPVAAAMTFQSPHALRAENMVVPVMILLVLGAQRLFVWVKNLISNRGLKRFILGGACLLWGFWVARFINNYFVLLAKEYPFATQWGFKELALYVGEEGGRFERVYITDRYDQPYILLLFYLKYPPARFQTDHELSGRDKFGFWTVRRFDKYRFRSISWDEMRDWRKVLLIGADEEIPSLEANVTRRIYFPSGQVAFEAVPL